MKNSFFSLVGVLRAFAAIGIFFLFISAPFNASAAGVSVSVDTDILDPVDAVIDKAVEPVLKEVVKAREAIDEMKRIGEKAEKIEEAVRNLENLEIKLEAARVEVSAQNLGVEPSKIRELRKTGKGWGVIAKEMGMHPGSLGVGHKNKNDDWKKSKVNKKKKKSKGKGKGKGKNK